MKKYFVSFGLFLVFAQAVLAQNSGTASVTGSVPEAFSITDTSNAAVSSTVSLGTLTPGTGGTLTSNTLSVRLRSNKAYQLLAQATSITVSGGGSADGGTSIQAGDIGFGITALNATGANVANSGTRADSIVTKHNYTSGFPAVTNGLTPFVAGTHGTLDDVNDGSSVQVLTGPRISTKGNMSTDNNFVLATIGVAVLPQYFTPNTGFSSTITLTLQSQ